ncbi:MAG: TolC family protein [Gemmatimonadaceae bacterium]|jgi:outer membrane protein TolC|nr:TolC family protein [Gemmatimonadaceae bacterium]MCC6432714.1 TolC family protein [Gemmatimonadaceae bacterium]
MTSVPPNGHAWVVANALCAPRFVLRRLAQLFAISALFSPDPISAQPATDSVRFGLALDSARVRGALERLRTSAVANSPALRAARANVELATARAAAAGAIAPAFFSAGLSEAPASNLDQGNLRFEVGRDLMTGRRRQAERRLADIDVQEAAVEVSLAERRVDGLILRDVLGAAGARRIALRLAAEDALLAGAEEGVRGRFGVGQARYVDVLRVRTERLRVQADRSATIAEARASRANLAAVLIGSEAITTLDAAIDTIAGDGLDQAWRSVLPALPSLDSLIAQSDVARMAEVGAARTAAARALLLAAQRPQLSAYAGIQRIGQANNGPTLGPSFGVTVSMPFTAARSNRLALAAATQSSATARIARDASLSETRGRLDAARERYLAARERLETFDAALLRGARDERESALAAYRTGSLSLIELLDFERALSRAEIERNRALIDAADAWADLLGADERSDQRREQRLDGDSTSPINGR